ncbi:hypothetical protein Tco_0613290 [Tanacetum coccineum]
MVLYRSPYRSPPVWSSTLQISPKLLHYSSIVNLPFGQSPESYLWHVALSRLFVLFLHSKIGSAVLMNPIGSGVWCIKRLSSQIGFWTCEIKQYVLSTLRFVTFPGTRRAAYLNVLRSLSLVEVAFFELVKERHRFSSQKRRGEKSNVIVGLVPSNDSREGLRSSCQDCLTKVGQIHGTSGTEEQIIPMHDQEKVVVEVVETSQEDDGPLLLLVHHGHCFKLLVYRSSKTSVVLHSFLYRQADWHSSDACESLETCR